MPPASPVMSAVFPVTSKSSALRIGQSMHQGRRSADIIDPAVMQPAIDVSDGIAAPSVPGVAASRLILLRAGLHSSRRTRPASQRQYEKTHAMDERGS